MAAYTLRRQNRLPEARPASAATLQNQLANPEMTLHSFKKSKSTHNARRPEREGMRGV
jgi:hypothetical protein